MHCLKNPYLLAAFFTIGVISIHSACAQNWRPFTSNEIYFYKLHSDNLPFVTTDDYFTIRADSSYIENGKEVIDFNEQVFYCDSCNTSFSCKWLNHQHVFGIGQMTVVNPGVYKFSNTADSTEFILKTFSGVGDRWLFNAADSVEAWVQWIKLQTVLGKQDYVKQIKTSKGDKIRISRDHGIIRMPSHISSNVLELQGIEGRDEGMVLGDCWEIFDFKPGDEFQFLEDHFAGNLPGGVHDYLGYFKIRIDDLKDSAEWRIFDITFFTQAIGTTWPLWHWDPHITMNSTWRIPCGLDIMANHYPGELVGLKGLNMFHYPLSLDDNDSASVVGASLLPTGDYEKNIHYLLQPGLFSNSTVDSDTLCYSNGYGVNAAFSRGLGQTKFSLFGGEGSMGYELNAYQKDGQTVGNLKPDSYFTTHSEVADLRDNNFLIYVNDVNLHISLKEDINGSIELVDLMGRTIETIKTDHGVLNYQMDISALSSCVYLIYISTDVGKHSQLVILPR